MPLRQFGDRLLADRRPAVLLYPEEVERSPTPQDRRHLQAKALLEVDFPAGAMRVRFALELHVSPDRRFTGSPKMDDATLPIRAFDLTMEALRSGVLDAKVILANPRNVLLEMSPLRPAPEGLVEGVVLPG